MQVRESEIQKIKTKLSSCDKCPLCNQAKNKVFGEGKIDSPLVLIGEAPGKNEDEQGKPFVGYAGRLLDELLSQNGLTREKIFITNIIRCRPPMNRRPLKTEVEACSSHLIDLLNIIRPKIIAPMGNSAINFIFNKVGLENKEIGEIHGTPMNAKLSFGDLIIFPLYHPAAAIYNRKLFTTLLEDFEKMVKILGV
ncbi:uracil-DNA glycosylase [Candidatus Bathyarchaeota archaeon]|nr:uracil-DNA glycosylase [Candidatus Bathyarchaeota archaeon]